ncbi:hypothetical protein IMG5_081050, partial [Ichthyophthirius multifiliis]
SSEQLNFNSPYIFFKSSEIMRLSIRSYPSFYIIIAKTQYMSDFMDNYFHQIFKHNRIFQIYFASQQTKIKINCTMSRSQTIYKLTPISVGQTTVTWFNCI